MSTVSANNGSTTNSTSGITISSELRSTFESARKSSTTAFIKVQISSAATPQFEPVHTERRGSGGWIQDYDQIQRYLDADVPCFIIFFKGSSDLMLCLYVPDSATPKNKMAYSSGKGALNSLLNAKTFGSNGIRSSVSQNIEQIFGTTKSEFTSRAYNSQNSVQSPMSEVEEALQALPKELSKNEFGKSQGYSLLATVSGKSLPPQLANYATSGNAAQSSTSSYRGGGQHNFFDKPSSAKAANKNPANRPPEGAKVLPGFGTAAQKSPVNSSASGSSAGGSGSYNAVKASPSNASSTSTATKPTVTATTPSSKTTTTTSSTTTSSSSSTPSYANRSFGSASTASSSSSSAGSNGGIVSGNSHNEGAPKTVPGGISALIAANNNANTSTSNSAPAARTSVTTTSKFSAPRSNATSPPATTTAAPVEPASTAAAAPAEPEPAVETVAAADEPQEEQQQQQQQEVSEEQAQAEQDAQVRANQEAYQQEQQQQYDEQQQQQQLQQSQDYVHVEEPVSEPEVVDVPSTSHSSENNENGSNGEEQQQQQSSEEQPQAGEEPVIVEPVEVAN